ncbi:hypothetical protein QVD17_27338 [Tagetes erecta]|uniref:Uncharacterized protein n=1 Tax=Tagetes erecta TaxID=13708 RepID=A0AAD8KEM2_TARER|nr:hypothetical protein QVD17_27338 [Tagetes erecta]
MYPLFSWRSHIFNVYLLHRTVTFCKRIISCGSHFSSLSTHHHIIHHFLLTSLSRIINLTGRYGLNCAV